MLTWIKRQSWPRAGIDPMLGALIAIRLTTAANWARTHAVYGASLFAYRTAPFQKVLRWSLVS